MKTQISTQEQIDKIFENSDIFKEFRKYFNMSQEGQNDYTIGCIKTANAIMPIVNELTNIVLKQSDLICLSNEVRLNLLVSALEGGSNYWYLLGARSVNEVEEYLNKDDAGLPFAFQMMRAIERGASIRVFDCETGEKLGYINLESIKNAEEIMLRDYPEQYAIAKQDEGDADTGDIWFQLSVMGEVVYG